MHNKPDSINDRQHPNPSIEGFIPNQQLLNVFVDYYVDGIKKRRILINRTHRTVDRHAIISCIVPENFSNEILEALLSYGKSYCLLRSG